MLAVVRAALLQETDPYWQIRAGLENLSGAPLARPDTWSWAPVEGLFRQTSPLWNDLIATAWRTLGWLGLTLTGAASIGAYLATSAALGRRLGARPLPMLVGTAPLLLLALPMLSPRASLAAVTLALLVVLSAPHWLEVVTRTRWAPALLLVAGGLVSWLGIWIHLSWLLLGPLAGVSWMLAAGGASAPRARRLAAAVAAEVGLVGGALVGPYGLGAVAYSREVAMASNGLLLEWLTPFSPGTAPRWALPTLVALVGAGGAVAHLARHHNSASTLTVVGLLAVAAPAAVAGISAIRFVGLALLFMVPLAGAWAAAVADRISERATEEPPRGVMRSARVRFWSNGSRWSAVLLAVLVLLFPVALLASTRMARPGSVARLAGHLPTGCRLYSDPATASGVLLIRPDVRVWVDGRADYWGHDRNSFALKAFRDGEIASQVVANANCALVPTGEWPEAALPLDANPQWQRLGAADDLILWVRRPSTS